MAYDKNNMTADQVREFLMNVLQVKPAGIMIKGSSDDAAEIFTITLPKGR